MKNIFVFLFVLAIAKSADVNRNESKSLVQPRIIGGDDAYPHEFPYQVALKRNGKLFCGGSIISPYFVLTAAHCAEKVDYVDVVCGAHNIEENEPTQKTYRVESKHIKIHEQWNRDELLNDIALVFIEGGIEFVEGIIGKIDMPSRSERDDKFVFRPCEVSGWGRYSDLSNDLSKFLKYARSWIITEFRCNLSYLGKIKKQHICMDNIGKSTCNGDSGGPLVVTTKEGKKKQAGIVSFGLFICSALPPVFTRVTEYLDWIDVNTYYSIIED